MKVKIGDDVSVNGLKAKVVEILGMGVDFAIAVVQGDINDVVAMFDPNSDIPQEEQKRIFTQCSMAYYEHTKPTVSILQ